ncbi:MAG: hypothetical protein KAQ97_04540 [Candidatus Fermentibacteraceae bacterium]|nr:hypothetical protein [Candidatus Fermentibacteraceae bacterium]
MGFLDFRKRNRADGYPGKGIWKKPRPLRRAEVQQKLCQGCGGCESVCYYGRIRVGRNQAASVKKGCAGCGACAGVCPAGAIIMISN